MTTGCGGSRLGDPPSPVQSPEMKKNSATFGSKYALVGPTSSEALE